MSIIRISGSDAIQASFLVPDISKALKARAVFSCHVAAFLSYCAACDVWDGCAQVASRVFRPGGKFRFAWQPESHRVYYGSAVDGDEHIIDEVMSTSLMR